MSDSPLARRILIPRSARNAGLGNDKLIYFERVPDGRLIIPPVAYAPDPVCQIPKPHMLTDNCLCGYVRREADSVNDLERISRRYEAQKKSEFARVDEKHQARMEAKMAEIRSRLHYAAKNARTPLERDLIRAALKRLEPGEANWRPRRFEGHLQIEATEERR